MFYLEHAPNPLLQSCVRTLWYCRAPGIAHRRERVLPNGCMEIVITLSRNYLTDCGAGGLTDGRLPAAIVVGARTRCGVVDTADMEELIGVAFQPGGFPRLFRERADALSEQTIDLADVWGQSNLIDRLRDAATPIDKLRTLDVLLTEICDRGKDHSPLLAQSLYLFAEKGLSVAECARSVGVSARRLSEVFRERVGLSPKVWCRIGRFQMALAALYRGADVRWSELALDCGYYDQSHFANDFHAFSGLNPTTYCTGRGPWQNHVPVR
jgi:AraC-like DNA-binding protein